MKKIKSKKTTQETSTDYSFQSNQNMQQNKDFRTITLVVLLIGISFFAGYLWNKVKTLEKNQNTVAQQQVPQQPPTASLDDVKDVFSKAHIKFGDTKSKLVVVEASDPSCPYCSIATGKNNELNSQAGSQFKLVEDGGTYVAPVEEIRKLVDEGKASYAMIYRNGHGNGEVAMKTLYCAYDQGKFWEVNDLIMSNDGYNKVNDVVKNDNSKFPELLSLVGNVVDKDKLQKCFESGKYDSKLSEDSTLGDKLGIQGTPGFYLNDKNFAGAYSFKDMQPVVDSFLN